MRISKVNSEKKTGLAFAAMGNYQIEFFEIDHVRYFAAYMNSGQSYREMVIDLADASVAAIESSGYQIITKRNTYSFLFVENEGIFKGSFSQMFLHWLPVRRFEGEISDKGIYTIRKEFESFLNSRAY